jgi:hypothetical protein
MPDLVTHTTIGYLVRNRKWDKYKLLFFMIGTVFPDVLSRTFMITFPDLRWFFHAFHTPIVILLFAYLFSIFFEKSMQWLVFKFVILGSAFHCFLDLFQIGISDTAYLWLFPITVNYDFQIGLFWSEDTMIMTPLFTVLFLISFLWEDKILGLFNSRNKK